MEVCLSARGCIHTHRYVIQSMWLLSYVYIMCRDIHGMDVSVCMTCSVWVCVWQWKTGYPSCVKWCVHENVDVCGYSDTCVLTSEVFSKGCALTWKIFFSILNDVVMDCEWNGSVTVVLMKGLKFQRREPDNVTASAPADHRMNFEWVSFTHLCQPMNNLYMTTPVINKIAFVTWIKRVEFSQMCGYMFGTLSDKCFVCVLELMGEETS